mmetsp:Transcript_19673/g.40300  ORF Transcript_19673/g.40300 Transcript_19673/m.40300 type:complete len:478 (-) Transcript_19673:235-1668(-)
MIIIKRPRRHYCPALFLLRFPLPISTSPCTTVHVISAIFIPFIFPFIHSQPRCQSRGIIRRCIFGLKDSLLDGAIFIHRRQHGAGAVGVPSSTSRSEHPTAFRGGSASAVTIKWIGTGIHSRDIGVTSIILRLRKQRFRNRSGRGIVPKGVGFVGNGSSRSWCRPTRSGRRHVTDSVRCQPTHRRARLIQAPRRSHTGGFDVLSSDSSGGPRRSRRSDTAIGIVTAIRAILAKWIAPPHRPTLLEAHPHRRRRLDLLSPIIRSVPTTTIALAVAVVLILFKRIDVLLRCPGRETLPHTSATDRRIIKRIALLRRRSRRGFKWIIIPRPTSHAHPRRRERGTRFGRRCRCCRRWRRRGSLFLPEPRQGVVIVDVLFIVIIVFKWIIPRGHTRNGGTRSTKGVAASAPALIRYVSRGIVLSSYVGAGGGGGGVGTDIAGFGAIGGGLVFVFGAGGDFDFVFYFFDAHHYFLNVCFVIVY